MNVTCNSASGARAENKSEGQKVTQISAHGALTKITRRLEQIRKRGNPKEFKKYISGSEYKSLYVLLDDRGCERVIDAVMDAKRSCFSGKTIPWKLNYKVSWKHDEAKRKRLRELEAKFGNDYDIAREMQLPLNIIRIARWKYCGRRRYRNQPHNMPRQQTLAAA